MHRAITIVLTAASFGILMAPAAKAESCPWQSAFAAIPGGYTKVEVTSDVRKAALYAVHSLDSIQLKLAKILLAEMQVVAGVNYRITMKVTTPEGKVRRARVVVYRDLRGRLNLTSWKWL
jgi:hypothetical protein